MENENKLSNNLSNNEIIKALECCSKNDGCNDCQFFDECVSPIEMAQIIMQNALDLINHQKADIELLHSDYTYKFVKAKAKAEVLSEVNARLYAYKTDIYIKGEELIIIPSTDYEQIFQDLGLFGDNLLKEMVGDDNA